MQDAELNNFLNNVPDKDNFQKEIVHMVRIRAIDRLHNDHTRKEFLVWYQNWYGFDSSGHKLASVADYPQGIDKQVMFSTNYNEDGTKYFKVEEEYYVHTIPFTVKAIDDAIDTCPDTDLANVQFSVAGMGRTYSGFSYEEFRNLSYEELLERGRTGNVQGPVDKEVLELDRQMSELRDRKKAERKDRK